MIDFETGGRAGGLMPRVGWSRRGQTGGGQPTRFDRVEFFRRGPSIRDSFASFHSIATRIAEGMAALGSGCTLRTRRK